MYIRTIYLIFLPSPLGCVHNVGVFLLAQILSNIYPMAWNIGFWSTPQVGDHECATFSVTGHPVLLQACCTAPAVFSNAETWTTMMKTAPLRTATLAVTPNPRPSLWMISCESGWDVYSCGVLAKHIRYKVSALRRPFWSFDNISLVCVFPAGKNLPFVVGLARVRYVKAYTWHVYFPASSIFFCGECCTFFFHTYFFTWSDRKHQSMFSLFKLLIARIVF